MARKTNKAPDPCALIMQETTAGRKQVEMLRLAFLHKMVQPAVNRFCDERGLRFWSGMGSFTFAPVDERLTLLYNSYESRFSHFIESGDVFRRWKASILREFEKDPDEDYTIEDFRTVLGLLETAYRMEKVLLEANPYDPEHTIGESLDDCLDVGKQTNEQTKGNTK